MKLIQQIWARMQTIWCSHDWYRVKHHGLPAEPWFMRCSKCLKMSDLDVYLTDKTRLRKGK